MKPGPFHYIRPETVADVLDALSAHEGAVLLAGGQSLLPRLHVRESTPDVVIDIGRVSALDYIESRDDHVALGAMTRMRTAELSSELAAWAPLVPMALTRVASVPVRNRGTVGGSVAFARPSAELPSVVVALDAEICLAGPEGEQVVAARDFFLGPHETVLSSRQLLTEIRIPRHPRGVRWAIEGYSRRRNDLALAAVYVGIGTDRSGRCDYLRLAVGGVGATPLRMERVESMLVGRELTPEGIAAAAEAVQEAIDPPTDWMGSADFRRHLAGVLTRRAILSAQPSITRKRDQ